MYKVFFLLAILFVPIFGISQKGKKLIEDGKYSSAFTYLFKSLSKDSNNIETNYYLSLLYIQESAKDYFSIRLSHKFYVRTKNILSSLIESKMIEKLKESGISNESVNALGDSIFIAFYRESEKINTEQAYINFIAIDKEIPNKLKKLAIENRDSCAFYEAKRINTVGAFDLFLMKYPNSKQNYDAIELRDKRAFDKAKEINSIISFKEFVENYPNSKLINEAKSILHYLAFENAKILNHVSSFESFISEYPNATQIGEAKSKIEELHFSDIIKNKSIEKCYNFIYKHGESKYNDTIVKILEDLKYSVLNNNFSIDEIELFFNEFPYSIRIGSLFNSLDSLYFVKLSNSDNIDEIEDFLDKYPNTKNFNFFKDKIENLSRIKVNFEYKNIDINIHPNYYQESCKIQVRKISFFDVSLFEKLESSIYKSFESSIKSAYSRIGPDGKKCNNCGARSLGTRLNNHHKSRLRTSFKVLSNNWYFWDDELFKNLNGLSIGIKEGDRDASNRSRFYTFSDTLVIDGNGYILNLYENKLLSDNSCKIESLLKTNYINLSKFEIQKPQVLNKKFEYLPYWANNPKYVEFVPLERTIFSSNDNLVQKCDQICTHNDSLVFFILPIGYSPNILDYPINEKIKNRISIESFSQNINSFQKHIDDTEDIGYKYFFRKYNLSQTVPFEPKNFNLPKNDAFVILEFNHLLDKLNIVYDAGFSNLMPIKLLIDKTNTLLIVQSVDNIEDDFHYTSSDRFKTAPNGELNHHYSITIFDLENKRELLTFPGIINDLTDNNLLIVNGYMVWEPKCIYYDELDLNELITYKSVIISPKIESSLQLDEFMSSIDLERKINTLRIETLSKSQNFVSRKIVKKYEHNFPNENNDEFLDYVSKTNRSLCECFYEKLSTLPDSIIISLNYVEYDLQHKELKLETTPVNDFIYNYLSQVDCDNWLDLNFPCDRILSNGLSYYSSVDYDTKKFTLVLNNIGAEYAKKIKGDVKVYIDFDHDILFNPEKIENYHQNQLLEQCVESSYNLNKGKLIELFRSRSVINNDYVPYANFYLIIDGEKIFLKFR
jgi:hypothetical protein